MPDTNPNPFRMVRTDPGLSGIVAAVKEERIPFERSQTYTLNAILKKVVTMLLLVIGLMMTRTRS